MSEMSAEQFVHRAFDVNLLDARQLESVRSELGTHDTSREDLISLLVRRELLTNYQVERLLSGKRTGFFYGDYKVFYLVGAGTFARVYRAVHKDTGQVVAVKVLRQRYCEDMITTERFSREARLVMPLRHPNIVPILDVYSERGKLYMVMEFVEGQTLRDFVKVRVKLDLPTALQLATDIVSGLDYAFSKGITHRDLKLSNVLVTSRGQAKLVDFGLAAAAGGDGKTDDNNPNPRSIDYAGLERACGVRKDDPRSDTYFAGCMLYHMLAGVSPLTETRDRMQRLSVNRYTDVKPINTLEPNLPHRVVMLVNKSIELNADRRFQSPGEMMAELKSIQKGLQQGTATSPDESGGTAATVTVAEEAPKLEGDSRTLMLVESNTKVLEALRERLKGLGYRVLVTIDPERALKRFEDDPALAHCVIFSTGDLGRSALDAFNQFASYSATANVPAILLVDQRQKQILENAKLGPTRVAVAMPLQFKQLRSVLLKLLAA